MNQWAECTGLYHPMDLFLQQLWIINLFICILAAGYDFSPFICFESKQI